MTSGYYCAIFPFCGGRKKQTKKKDNEKTKAFYDWATTGIPVIKGQTVSDRPEDNRLGSLIILSGSCSVFSFSR